MPILGKKDEEPVKTTEITKVNAPIVQLISIDKIKPNPHNLRQTVNKEKLNELANSIKFKGQVEPIKVRPTKDGMYEIVYGYRRWFACKLLLLSKVKCMVEDLSDDDLLMESIIENITHEELSKIDEAKGFDVLCNKFGYSTYKIANLIGKSEPYVVQIRGLLKTLPDFQQLIKGVDDAVLTGTVIPPPTKRQRKLGLTWDENAKLISTPQTHLPPSTAIKIVEKVKDKQKQLEIGCVVADHALTQDETIKLIKETEKNPDKKIEEVAIQVMDGHALKLDIPLGIRRQLEHILVFDFGIVEGYAEEDIKKLGLDLMKMGMEDIKKGEYHAEIEFTNGKDKFKRVAKCRDIKLIEKMKPPKIVLTEKPKEEKEEKGHSESVYTTEDKVIQILYPFFSNKKHAKRKLRYLPI